MPPDEVRDAVSLSGGVQHPAELLWNLIIRPPRAKYKLSQLGPTHFRVAKGCFARRTDVELRNPRGHALQCSFFEPLPQAAWEHSRQQQSEAEARAARRLQECRTGVLSSGLAQATSSSPPRSGSESQTLAVAPTPTPQLPAASAAVSGEAPEPLPCVVFLHGNSSCRLEAVALVSVLLPLQISLFCFDFSGCGLSEGQFISLGWYERDDLSTCVDYLRASGRVSTIALWGRSMGAFTALLHADRDPSIAGLVLDSAFVSLNLLAEELARSYAKVPAWMVRAVLPVVRGVIQSKAEFDIDDLEAENHVSRSFSPVLFVAAQDDDFIMPHHAQKLFEAYQGEKEFHMVTGDHNSARPEACQRKAALFLCRAFHCPRLDRLLEMHTSGLYDIFSGPVPKADQDREGPVSDGDEGAALCRQMRVIPALKLMRLLHQTRCRRPFSMRTDIKLDQEKSEAGFFVRVDSAVAKDDTVPRYLIITVSTAALIVSRVCDTELETVAAAAGVPQKEVRSLTLQVDMQGSLSVQLGDSELLEVGCGSGIREEITVWLMLLHGLIQYSGLTVEDGEATLGERLGDVVLRQRHLGQDSWTHTSATARSAPAIAPLLPPGDFGVAPPTARACAAFGSPPRAERLGGAEAVDAGLQVLKECALRPEALIGWRISVESLGEGVVVGVRRRLFRSTHYKVLGLAQGTADHREAFVTSPAQSREGPISTVFLRRKESHRRKGVGLVFQPVCREL